MFRENQFIIMEINNDTVSGFFLVLTSFSIKLVRKE